MGEYAKVIGSHGPPAAELQALGQSWSLTGATWQIKGQFEHWLEQRAIAAVKRHKPPDDFDPDDETYQGLTPQEYSKQLREVFDAIAAGVYSWRSQVFFESLGEVLGSAKLLAFLLAKHHPDIDDAQAAAIVEAEPKAWTRLMRQIVSAVPNFTATATPAAETS